MDFSRCSGEISVFFDIENLVSICSAVKDHVCTILVLSMLLVGLPPLVEGGLACCCHYSGKNSDLLKRYEYHIIMYCIM